MGVVAIGLNKLVDENQLRRNQAEQAHYNNLYAQQAAQAKAYQEAQDAKKLAAAKANAAQATSAANSINKNTSSPSVGALSYNNKLLASTNPVAYEGGTGVGTVVNKSLGNGITPKPVTEPAKPVDEPAKPALVNDDTPTIAQDAAKAQVEIQPVTPTLNSGLSYTPTEKPTFSYDAEKPTYKSSYDSSVYEYTPVSYSAGNYSVGGGGGGGGFTGRTYEGVKFEPSQEYYEAMAETKKLLEQIKGGRTSFTDKVNAQLQDIENTAPFEYDFNKDPLFQNMLQSYMRDGRVAMQDTMGQAAALTGGYGSSYSQAVGNQAYNNMVQEAYDNLPEYYQTALTKYQYDLQNKYNLLNEYRASDETEYGRMLNDYNLQYGWANDQYNRELQKANFDESSRQWALGLTESSQQSADRLNESAAENAADNATKAAIASMEASLKDRQFAAQMAQEEARYQQELALKQEQMEYNRYRDAISDYYNDYAIKYGEYRDSVGDARYDDATAYDRYRDLINDARYDDATAYDRYRDLVSDARYADETAYSREQDAIANALARDKFNDSSAQGWADINLARDKYNTAKDQWQSEYDLSKAAQEAKATSSSGSSSSAEPEKKKPSQTQMDKIKDAYNKGGWPAANEVIASIPDDLDDDYIEKYIADYGNHYSSNNYELSKDTYNWFWGLNNNNEVTDPRTGQVYTLSKLVSLIAEQEGISESEVKKKYKDFLNQYN